MILPCSRQGKIFPTISRADLRSLFPQLRGELLAVHLSANGFYETIDATNLGFGQNKSITSWSSSLALTLNLAKASRGTDKLEL